jgi:hypothetical protein
MAPPVWLVERNEKDIVTSGRIFRHAVCAKFREIEEVRGERWDDVELCDNSLMFCAWFCYTDP